MGLEKYFEATATVGEERTLREYFSQDEVAPHLEQYKPMFNYFSMAKEEKYTKQVPLKPRVNYYKWLSVAAAVVLTFGIYFGSQYQEEQRFGRKKKKKPIKKKKKKKKKKS